MEKYNQLNPEIIAQIQAVSDHVLVGDDINVDYARDEMPIYGTHMPDLVVQPTSTEEVAAVMKICYENTIPVTPRGAGVVNKKVLENCGIDSEKYSGFAFGLGLERIAMLKYGINNIKMLFESDLRVLDQIDD